MRGVQEVCEQEADELEGHADQAVPHEAEDGADGEAVDEDGVGGVRAAWGEDRGFPVGRRRVGGGGFVGLQDGVSLIGRGWRRKEVVYLQEASPRLLRPARASHLNLQRHHHGPNFHRRRLASLRLEVRSQGVGSPFVQWQAMCGLGPLPYRLLAAT